MSNFDNKTVMELRKRTNCGMMQCKGALIEANGNLEEAIKFLREKGIANADKKSGRITNEGIVHATLNDSKNVGVIIEINSETDFVAKNDNFKDFVKEITNLILNKKPKNVEELGMLELSNGINVNESVKEKISVIGENINIRRFKIYENEFDNEIIETYIHGTGRIGVMTKFKLEDSSKKDNVDFIEFRKNICMQIAAINPKFLNTSDVDSKTVEEEKNIFKSQSLKSGKKEEVVEKMIAGKIQKFYKEICLYEQEYVKDSSKTIKEYALEVSEKISSKVTILEYVRFERGTE